MPQQESPSPPRGEESEGGTRRESWKRGASHGRQVFRIDDYVTGVGEPARRAIHQGAVTDTGLWTIRRGEEIPLHVHPTSTTVWVVMRGSARYLLAQGVSEHVAVGYVAVAEAGMAHGCVGEAEETQLLTIEAPRPAATSAPYGEMQFAECRWFRWKLSTRLDANWVWINWVYPAATVKFN